MGTSAAKFDACTCSCDSRPLGTGRTDKVTSLEAPPKVKQDVEIEDLPCDAMDGKLDGKDNSPEEKGAVVDSWVPSTIAAFERLSEAVVQREELTAVFENLEGCDDAEDVGEFEFDEVGECMITEGSEFRIRIQKHAIDDLLGVEFDILGTSLMVTRIEGGAIETHNQDAEPEKQIRIGDFFTCVNGHGGDARQITHALVRAATLDIIVKHPRAWTIFLDRGDKTSVGLGVDYTTNGASLMVTGVYPGLVRNWNFGNEGAEVEVDDRIVTINGTSGSAEKLLESLKRGPPRLELQIFRA